MPKETAFINGLPATLAQWRAWEESIGIGPIARARKKAAYEHVKQLADQLKREAQARDERRD